MRIVWSPQSLRDLRALHDYIAQNSEHYVDVTIARIFSAAERPWVSRNQDASFRRGMILKSGKLSWDVFGLYTVFVVR